MYTWDCSSSGAVRNYRYLRAGIVAAAPGVSKARPYLTRYIKDCSRERQDVAQVRGTDTLYLYRSTEDIGAFLSGLGVVSPRCGYLDDIVVCSPKEDLSYLR